MMDNGDLTRTRALPMGAAAIALRQAELDRLGERELRDRAQQRLREAVEKIREREHRYKGIRHRIWQALRPFFPESD
jgi:hypothetical protein